MSQRIMQSLIALFFLASAGVAAIHGQENGDADKQATQKDLGSLQGTWEAITVQKDGKDAMDKYKNLTITFKDNIWIGNADGKQKQWENAENSTIRLDPSKSPKEIDRVMKVTDIGGRLITIVAGYLRDRRRFSENLP